MPATENQGFFLNRISIRRNQFTAIENDGEIEDIELFQKHVADRFSGLLSAPSKTVARANSNGNFAAAAAAESATATPILSISWFRNLLDAFVYCESEFKALLLASREPSQFSKPPFDRLIPDFLDRSVKALDVCKAVTQGLDLVHHWQKLAQIVVTAFQQKPIGEGQIKRARKALTTLLTSMVFDDKENSNNNYHGKWTDRTKYFGRRGPVNNKDRPSESFRSLSWSLDKSWSAAKQIQTMSGNLVAPRGSESAGLAMPVYIMNTIMVLVVWALVSAIPCQERNGLATHFHVPRNSGWAQRIIGLQEKIGEEWKSKEKSGTPGLLEELQRMDKVARSLVEFSDSFVYPLEEERAAELTEQVSELAEICRKMEVGLGPLQQQVREVFHRIVKSRAEVLDVLDQVSKLATLQY